MSHHLTLVLFNAIHFNLTGVSDDVLVHRNEGDFKLMMLIINLS